MNHKPLQASATLDRWVAILASFHEPVQVAGKCVFNCYCFCFAFSTSYRKALRSLLNHTPSDNVFLSEVLTRAFVTVRELGTSNARFFGVVADVIRDGQHGFSFSQVVCLGLSNLSHPLSVIRRQAFDILEAVHERASGLLPLTQYEAAVCSAAPNTYLHAHRLISTVLAGEHPDQATHVLAQFAGWIPQIFNGRSAQGPLLLLQSLEHWMPSLNLLDSNGSGISREGRSAINHLMALTLRYVDTHAEQILVLWARLVDAGREANGYVTVMFLLQQAPKVSSTIFLGCVAKVVACLAQSAVGERVISELCQLLDPSRMLPSYDHKVTIPDAEEIEEWSDLDVLFSEQPKLTLAQTQFVLLFLCETTMERSWPLDKWLPALLTALFLHLTHKQSFIQEQCQKMLFQLLRSCLPTYDELSDRSSYPSRTALKTTLRMLEEEAESRLWHDDDSADQAAPKLKWLSSQILRLLEPLYPQLRAYWGAWSLRWGTLCLRPEMAYRSLQLYRALAPPVSGQDLDELLKRLAHTVADEDAGIQIFSVEIILTLTAMTKSESLDVALLPKLFWSAVVCLSTTVETEFYHALGFLESLLERMDLDDYGTIELLLERRPPTWIGSSSLQSCLLTGLRSSVTSGLTYKLLQRLCTIDDARLVDASEGRVRDLYTLSLPWCLHAMSNGTHDEALHKFALDIGHLAEEEERQSINRIMTSFAKGRFRTKDDFLRESVASLREHYGSEHWTEVITLLMGMMLNQERWLQVNTMQILKILFQQRETRDLLSSELLMPLLRLLETDLAAQALDVLDEPVQISGGPAAKHILRMSLHHHLRADVKEVESVAEVFGIPQQSGWCVPRSGARRDICRSNLSAVVNSSPSSSRLSPVIFQPEDTSSLIDDTFEDELGDMVQNLHELSSF